MCGPLGPRGSGLGHGRPQQAPEQRLGGGVGAGARRAVRRGIQGQARGTAGAVVGHIVRGVGQLGQQQARFGAVFRRLSSDPDVRAVILSGSGNRAFTTGLDVQAAAQGTLDPAVAKADGARRAAQLRRHIAEFQECITAMEACEKRAFNMAPPY